MTRRSHAARSCLLLVLLYGPASGAQVTSRPGGLTPKPPAPTQPASEAKPATKGLYSAPRAEMEKAFREALGREPGQHGELEAVTRFVLEGTTYNCIPPSGKVTEWDCGGAITGWLHDTPGGQKEYALVFARAVKEVFGVDWADPSVKPEEDGGFGRYDYSDLVRIFTANLHPVFKGPTSVDGVLKGKSTLAQKTSYSLESTVERAFLQALKRKPTEADVKAVVPIFMKEQATFRRMVEILQGFESLKEIK